MTIAESADLFEHAEVRVIPTIDIGAFRAGGAGPARAAFVSAMGAAAEADGFALIVGHGIAPAVIEGGFDAGRRFFVLPDDYKSGIREFRSNRGY